MRNQLHIFSGYLKIRITGGQTERFLNLCRKREIFLQKLHFSDEETLTALISVRDFRRMETIHRKTGVHIHILEKHGLPFFFYRNKKRKAFFAGILIFLLLLWFLSGRIWNIRVEGCRRYTQEEILDFLKEQSIVHGMASKNVSCSDIAASVREEFPDISWVSAKLTGTQLLLTVREGVFGADTADEMQTACSIAADESGTIVKMITRAGVPVKSAGDSCEKGELLVDGCLELKNDSQEVTGYEYIHADADIFIKRSVSYYDEFPLKHTEILYTGKEKKGWYLQTNGWYLRIGTAPGTGFAEILQKKFLQSNQEDAESGWLQFRLDTPVRLNENFYLPFSAGKIIWKEYRETTGKYTKKQAKALAFCNLQHYEEKLIEKGVQISANNVTIDVDQSTCKSHGSLEIIQKTGSETPVEKREAAIERNTEDDEQHY